MYHKTYKYVLLGVQQNPNFLNQLQYYMNIYLKLLLWLVWKCIKPFNDTKLNNEARLGDKVELSLLYI